MKGKSAYAFIGAGAFFAALPVIFILSLIPLLLYLPEEEIDAIFQGAYWGIDFCDIFVLFVLKWILNKRFDLHRLDKFIYASILLTFINFLLPFFLGSWDAVESVENYIFLLEGPVVIAFGLGLRRSNISLYRMRKRFGTWTVLMGIGEFFSGLILIFVDMDNALLVPGLFFILFVIIALVYLVLEVILLLRAFRDKLYEALI